jgi:hypothetical protein
MTALKLPLQLGMANGYNANFITDAEGNSLVAVFGINLNTTVDEARASPNCAKGIAAADAIIAACNAQAGLVRAAKRALSAIEKDLLPLHAKMAVLSGPGLKIYEDSPVYKGLIAERDAIKAALAAAEPSTTKETP